MITLSKIQSELILPVGLFIFVVIVSQTFSICFSSLVNLEKKFDKEELQKIILIEIPKAIYPNIWDTLIYLFEKSGFKQVNFEKEVDFEKLYQSKKN